MAFQDRFATEEACREYLFASRWPDGFRCRRCGDSEIGVMHRRRLVWQCKGCGAQTAVTAGTVMHGTRQPLRLWFWAAYLVATHHPGISAGLPAGLVEIRVEVLVRTSKAVLLDQYLLGLARFGQAEEVQMAESKMPSPLPALARKRSPSKLLGTRCAAQRERKLREIPTSTDSFKHTAETHADRTPFNSLATLSHGLAAPSAFRAASRAS